MTDVPAPLASAALAASSLTPAILQELQEAILAAHRPGDRRSLQQRIRTACELAEELLTRLEVAETEFCASPHEEEQPAKVPVELEQLDRERVLIMSGIVLERVKTAAACQIAGLHPRVMQQMAQAGEIPGAIKHLRPGATRGLWTFDVLRLRAWVAHQHSAQPNRGMDRSERIRELSRAVAEAPAKREREILLGAPMLQIRRRGKRVIKRLSSLPPLVESAVGYVYVIGFAKFVKIGWSLDPERRLFDLQEALPVRLSVHLIRPGIRKDETEFHRRFDNYRLRGEWFAFTGDLRAWIYRRCPN